MSCTEYKVKPHHCPPTLVAQPLNHGWQRPGREQNIHVGGH